MSRLYYFASDNVLEEQPNPYVKMVSVNQAIKMGMDIDLDLIGDDIDRDEPDVILFFEDEEKLKYPNILVMDKEEYYDDIGTKKQFCSTLEWNYSNDTVGVVEEILSKEYCWISGEELTQMRMAIQVFGKIQYQSNIRWQNWRLYHGIVHLP